MAELSFFVGVIGQPSLPLFRFLFAIDDDSDGGFCIQATSSPFLCSFLRCKILDFDLISILVLRSWIFYGWIVKWLQRNILADYKEEIDGGVRELSVRLHLAELFSLDLLRCYQAWSLPRRHRKFLWRCCTVFLPRRFPHLRTVGYEGTELQDIWSIFMRLLWETGIDPSIDGLTK